MTMETYVQKPHSANRINIMICILSQSPQYSQKIYFSPKILSIILCYYCKICYIYAQAAVMVQTVSNNKHVC